MCKKKVVMFVTEQDVKSIPSYEKDQKEKYGVDNLCLSFAHNVAHHEVAARAKSKKPTCIVIHLSDSKKAEQIKKSVTKQLNGSSPQFLVIGLTIEGMTTVDDHRQAKEKILAMAV